MADQKVSDLPSLSGADVDAADLLYIIDSSAGSAGSKKITVGQYQLAPVSGGTANGVLYLNGSKVVTTGSDLVFDGTNLGVGTNSPGAKLEVASGKVLLSNGQSYAVKSSGGAVNDVIGLTAGNVLTLGGGGATDSIQFWNQGLPRMTLDSSGNLGLGVTPSAWGGGFKALEMSNGSVSINANGPYINQNAIFDTVWRYKANGLAAQYQQIAGQHQWATAPSGTAGNPITGANAFVQTMTLDASGNLLVGGTSALYGEKFGITATGTTSVPTSLSALNGALALISTGQAGTAYGGVGFQDSGGGGTAVVFGRGTSYDTNILFCTNPSTTTTSGAMTERARITSGGDLLVGKTALGLDADPGIELQASGRLSPVVDNSVCMFVSRLTAGGDMITFRVNGSNAASITATTTSVSYNTSSDRRLKKDITPAPQAGADIDAIEIVSHGWIKNDAVVKYGVIAQDLNAIAPAAVTAGDDGDDVEQPWGVDYSKLVPMLIKEIQSLRARVAALESA